MQKFVLIKIAGKTERIPVSEGQALEIERRLNGNAGRQETLTLNGSTFRFWQIQGIVSNEINDSKKLAFKGTEAHQETLRKALREAANACKICPRDMENGKPIGSGFIFKGRGGPGEHGEMEICACQKSTKMLHGVDPYDFDYMRIEFHPKKGWDA